MNFIKSFILILLFSSTIVHARPIVSALSQNQVNISARFQGTELLLFGASQDFGQIIIVIQGPQKSYLARKKEKILGIWLNRQQVVFENVYDFYAVYSSIPLDKIKNQFFLANLNVGLKHVPLDFKGKTDISEINNFREAVVMQKTDQGLYQRKLNTIEFMGDTLFKTSLSFPKKLPSGSYNIEVYLIDDTDIIGMQSIPLQVKKVGIEALISNLAYNYKYFYGILSILLALFSGWLASLIFWKV